MSGEAQIRARGYVGADPEVKTLPSGKEVLEFSVALGVRREDPRGSGTWVDVRTDWIRCAVWGFRIPEVLANVRKGEKVEVLGQLTPTPYLTKAGEPAVSLDIMVQSVTIVPRPPREGGNGAAERIDSWAPATAVVAAGAPF